MTAAQSAIVSLAVSMLVFTAGLFGYHQRFVQPMQRIGVIDVTEIWQIKEKEFANIVTRTGATDKDREKAMEMAGKDLFFVVGTTWRFKTWMIIGLFYPPRSDTQ